MKLSKETIPNQNCVKYLCASYMYYEQDCSVMEDYEFDILCLDLYSEFDKVTHWAKELIDHESLQAGSGFDLFAKIPGGLWLLRISGEKILKMAGLNLGLILNGRKVIANGKIRNRHHTGRIKGVGCPAKNKL